MRKPLLLLLPWLGLPLAASATDTLEPVIVTATRSPVSALAYAGSATRIESLAIADLGATHSSELLNRAPGSFLQRGSGQEVLVAIRSPVLTGAGACGAFLVLEDEVPIRPVGFCNVNQLFEVNLEQAGAVEVLRGPGIGVLGANAVHGVANVISANPERLPAFGANLEIGSDEYRQVALSTRWLGDATRLGIVAHHTRDGGYRVDSGFDETKANVTLERELASGRLRVTIAATDLDQETAGFIVGRDAYRDPRLRRSNANPEAYRQARSARAVAHFRSRGGFDARLYVRTSDMDFLQHFLLGQPLERNGQDSAGAMLAWSGELGALRWRTGLDLEAAQGYLVEDQANPTTGAAPGAIAIRPAGLHYDYRVDSRVAAPWANLEWTFAPRWTASAALRADWIEYDYDNRMRDGNTAANGTPCPGGCLYSRPADRKDTFTSVGPRLGVSWRFADSQVAYVSGARGYRPPEVTELYRLQRQQNVANLDSETGTSFEVGVRGRTGALAWDFAAFHMDKRNVILRDSSGFNVDGGKTRHRGFEYEVAWTPWAPLTLGASGTLAKHTYEFARAIEQGETIRSGNFVDTAPKHLATLRAELRPLDRARIALEWTDVGAYYADASNLNRYPGHDLVNLRAAVDVGRGMTLRARVLNLADRAYADRADISFGNWRYFPGRDRTWFLEIGYAAPGAAGAR